MSCTAAQHFHVNEEQANFNFRQPGCTQVTQHISSAYIARLLPIRVVFSPLLAAAMRMSCQRRAGQKMHCEKQPLMLKTSAYGKQESTPIMWSTQDECQPGS